MLILSSVVTALLAVATLLPLWRHPHWLVRGLDFPRLQLAVVATLLLVAVLSLLDPQRISTWVLLAVIAACLVRQLWWILPSTPIWPKEVLSSSATDPTRRIRILTANVLTTNRDADRIVALVRATEPDVLVTLESDAWWEQQLDVLRPLLPHVLACPLDNLYGMHLYSALPLHDAEIRYLVEDDVPSMHAELRLRSGDSVRLHCLHPAPPSPTENVESAERDAELVIVARSIAETESDRPVIVTGDLNDVAWSRTTRLFRKLSGLLDPRVGRGMYNTFHADHPLLRWPLDHLFHSRHFTLKSIERLPHIGSDHFALLTELMFEPDRRDGHDGLEADEDDVAHARDIAEAQGVSRTDVPRPGR